MSSGFSFRLYINIVVKVWSAILRRRIDRLKLSTLTYSSFPTPAPAPPPTQTLTDEDEV